MTPTADQAAKIIVLACRAVYVNPLDIDKRPMGSKSWKTQRLRLARAYAALAMRSIFPTCTSGAIGRMVGASEPPAYLGRILAARAKGDLRDYDPEVLARIVQDADMRVEVVAGQRIIDEDPTEACEGPSVPEAVGQRAREKNEQAPAPAPAPQPESAFVRFGAKKRLEDMLRQAVINTGGRPVE